MVLMVLIKLILKSYVIYSNNERDEMSVFYDKKGKRKSINLYDNGSLIGKLLSDNKVSII